MEYRQLAGSTDKLLGPVLKVPVLSFGTGIEADIHPGLTMFDSADVYSAGQAEEIVGNATKGRRDLLTRTRDPAGQIAKLIPALSPGCGSLEPVGLVQGLRNQGVICQRMHEFRVFEREAVVFF